MSETSHPEITTPEELFFCIGYMNISCIENTLFRHTHNVILWDQAQTFNIAGCLITTDGELLL